MEFGEAVKLRRESLGMSQSDLSAASGTSKAMISEIESGKKNPTLKVACSISVALNCQISDLLDLPPVVRFSKLEKDAGQVLLDPETGVRRRLLAPHMVQHGVQVLEFTMPVGGVVDFGSDGQGVLEHITCLEGRVRVERKGEEVDSTLLEPGESANYASDEVHSFANASENEVTRMILVIDSTRRGQPVDLSELAN